MQNTSLTHNQKLVVKWKEQHKELVNLVDKIIHWYKEKRQAMIRVELEKFNELLTKHLMSEDIEFYKFSMLEESLDEEIKKSIEDFVETFEETKMALNEFLDKYTQTSAVYDQKFILSFKALVDELEKRISYENTHLYKILEKK